MTAAVKFKLLHYCFRSWSSNPAIGVRLRRGYEAPAAGAVEVDVKAEEADNFAARVPVNRLVFVVHGIGQVDHTGPHLLCIPLFLMHEYQVSAWTSSHWRAFGACSHPTEALATQEQMDGEGNKKSFLQMSCNPQAGCRVRCI